MKAHATPAEIEAVVERVQQAGFQAHKIVGVERTVVACVGEERGKEELAQLEFFSGVDSVLPVLKPYKLAARELHPDGSRVDVGGVEIGGKRLAVMAGPCAIESAAQMQGAAQAVKAAGAHMLRGGAFKPRTSPYSFQGMEHEGLLLLERAGREVGLPVVTEVMDPHDIERVAEHADMLQVGARNAQNFSLLRRLGKLNKPILLKRGMSTKLDESLMAAEYILSGGNTRVVLCERGIRTFETATRNTFDAGAIVVLAEICPLPVIADPSHSAGRRSLVPGLARAAVAAGADGIIVEVHPHPEQAWSDGEQSLTPEEFDTMMADLAPWCALRASCRPLPEAVP